MRIELSEHEPLPINRSADGPLLCDLASPCAGEHDQEHWLRRVVRRSRAVRRATRHLGTPLFGRSREQRRATALECGRIYERQNMIEAGLYEPRSESEAVFLSAWGHCGAQLNRRVVAHYLLRPADDVMLEHLFREVRDTLDAHSEMRGLLGRICTSQCDRDIEAAAILADFNATRAVENWGRISVVEQPEAIRFVIRVRAAVKLQRLQIGTVSAPTACHHVWRAAGHLSSAWYEALQSMQHDLPRVEAIRTASESVLRSAAEAALPTPDQLMAELVLEHEEVIRQLRIDTPGLVQDYAPGRPDVNSGAIVPGRFNEYATRDPSASDLPDSLRMAYESFLLVQALAPDLTEETVRSIDPRGREVITTRSLIRVQHAWIKVHLHDHPEDSPYSERGSVPSFRTWQRYVNAAKVVLNGGRARDDHGERQLPGTSVVRFGQI